MQIQKSLTRLVCAFVFAWTVLLAPSVQAHDHHAAGPEAAAVHEMAEAAAHFINALTPEQRAKLQFTMEDEERLNWHFIPRARKGLPLKEMSLSQQHLAHALLSSALSHRGYRKAVTIMSLEEVLRELEAGKGTMVRDESLYYFSVFGKPGDSKAWGWRVEGHHFSMNIAIIGGHLVTTTPTFMGSNPGEIQQGPRKGLRILGHEEDLGRQLVKSLTDKQRTTGIINTTAIKEITTEAAKRVKPLQEAGIAYKELDRTQRAQLKSLVEEFVRNYRSELADSDLKRIDTAGWNKVRFAWAGGMERGEGHYFRVQGPTFLLEFANTQNNNHPHAVWRDFDRDFGVDLLKEHYEKHHH